MKIKSNDEQTTIGTSYMQMKLENKLCKLIVATRMPSEHELYMKIKPTKNQKIVTDIASHGMFNIKYQLDLNTKGLFRHIENQKYQIKKIQTGFKTYGEYPAYIGFATFASINKCLAFQYESNLSTISTLLRTKYAQLKWKHSFQLQNSIATLWTGYKIKDLKFNCMFNTEGNRNLNAKYHYKDVFTYNTSYHINVFDHSFDSIRKLSFKLPCSVLSFSASYPSKKLGIQITIKEEKFMNTKLSLDVAKFYEMSKIKLIK